jgi:hypothetical protein
MRPAGSEKGCASRLLPAGAPLANPKALHVRNLSQHSQDEFADAPADLAQTVHFDSHTFRKQCTDGGLNIESVATKPVHSVNMHAVAFANPVQEVTESWALCGRDGTTYPLVSELAIKSATKRGSLRLNALIS